MREYGTILPMPVCFRPLLMLAFALAVAAGPGLSSALAQAIDEEYRPRTGDAWIDRQLADINTYAARYPQSFADEVARYYAVPRAYVEAMMQQPAWVPGDIVMACGLAQEVGQSCRAVVREWSRDHEDGWEGVAQRLQSAPGPTQYRQLRERIKQSYLRWARPLAG